MEQYNINTTNEDIEYGLTSSDSLHISSELSSENEQTIIFRSNKEFNEEIFDKHPIISIAFICVGLFMVIGTIMWIVKHS